MGIDPLDPTPRKYATDSGGVKEQTIIITITHNFTNKYYVRSQHRYNKYQ